MRSYHGWFPLVLCLLLVCAVAPASAQHGSKPYENQTGLVLWNLPLRPAYSAGHAANLKVVDDFLAAYPNIRIEAGGGPQLQRFGRGTREFLMSQAAGIAPDVVEMSDVDLQDFISRNFLLPMNPYLKKDGALDGALKDPFARQFVKEGKVYALPMTARPQGFMLVYRKDAFRRAGLDPEKPPKTCDEFLKCAEALTDPANDQYGFVLPTIETKGPLEAGGFVELVFALNGVEVIKQDTDGSWLADFADNPKAHQAMEFLRPCWERRLFGTIRTTAASPSPVRALWMTSLSTPITAAIWLSSR